MTATDGHSFTGVAEMNSELLVVRVLESSSVCTVPDSVTRQSEVTLSIGDGDMIWLGIGLLVGWFSRMAWQRLLLHCLRRQSVRTVGETVVQSRPVLTSEVRLVESDEYRQWYDSLRRDSVSACEM